MIIKNKKKEIINDETPKKIYKIKYNKKQVEEVVDNKPTYDINTFEILEDELNDNQTYIGYITNGIINEEVPDIVINKSQHIKTYKKPELNLNENYKPIINSNTIINGYLFNTQLAVYLQKENYLSEFKTEEDKAKARANLGIDRVGSDASDVTYSVEGKDFKNVEDALNALFYVKIAITYFSASPSEAEIGELINTVTFSWNVNKDKYTQSINSEPLDVSIKSISESNVTTNITKTLEVTDGLTSDSRRASITFKLGKYYGVFNTSPSSEEIINSFKRNLNLSKENEITVTAGSQDHIYIMVPLSMKDLRFSVGGFEGGFHIINEHYQFIRYGKTFDNVLFESDEPGLGTTKIKLL